MSTKFDIQIEPAQDGLIQIRVMACKNDHWYDVDTWQHQDPLTLAECVARRWAQYEPTVRGCPIQIENGEFKDLMPESYTHAIFHFAEEIVRP